MPHEKSEPQSRYKQIETPVFETDLPANLLAKLDAEERDMALTFEKLEKRQKWILDKILEGNRVDMELDCRLSPLEETFGTLAANWKLVAFIGPIIFGAILFIIKVAAKVFFGI